MTGRAPEGITDIYTDGVCTGSTGPGGWGAVLRYGAKDGELQGGEPAPTSSGRMDLMAAVRGLEQLTRPVRVRLHTNSAYVRDGVTRRLFDRQRNGPWGSEPIQDVDLWQRFAAVVQRHRVEWIWDLARSEDLVRAEALATTAMLGFVNDGGTPDVGYPPARCIHDLVRNECVDCRPTRPGLPARVAMTSGGAVFHISEQCVGLHDGWRKVSRGGGTPSDLVWVPIADALATGRGSCEKCCGHLT